MREAKIVRDTKETQIRLKLNLDGTGKMVGATKIGFLDHMLNLFAKQSLFDIEIECKGSCDLNVDDHHLIEDIAIVLGKAIKKALGDKKGINRYGFAILPMDEVLMLASLDLSGRFAFAFDCPFEREKVNDFSAEMVKHFCQSLAENLSANLHIKMFYGENAHHKIEGIFKAIGSALRKATELDLRAKDVIPSTKGVL